MRRPEPSGDSGPIAHVEAFGLDARAESTAGGRDGVEARGVAAVEDEGGAGRRVMTGEGRADAARRTGDQDDGHRF
jgi:hypothetical protein